MAAVGLGLTGVPAVQGSPPTRVVVGPPPGISVTDRLDPERRGRSSARLPRTPLERWRRSLQGALETPPLVDREGGILAWLVRGDVVRVTAEGALAWRVPLACAPSNVPLVMLSDRRVAALCGDGTLYALLPDGSRRVGTPLGGSARQTRATPLARDDGSLFVALDDTLVHLSPTFEVLGRARLVASEVPTGGLLPFEGGVLVTTAAGEVWHWRPPLEPRKAGSFGGKTFDGAIGVGPRAIAAIVDSERLVLLDPVNGGVRALAYPEDDATFEGPPSLAPTGALLVTSNVGQLYVVDPAREDSRTLELEPRRRLAPLPASARRAGRDIRSGVPLVVDADGRIAYARQHGAVSFVAPRAAAPEPPPLASPCALVRALVPMGERRLLVACEDGTLVLWSDP